MDDAKRYGRSWRWLRVRINGLLAVPPMFVMTSEAKPRFVIIQQTRLGLALDPPDFRSQQQQAAGGSGDYD